MDKHKIFRTAASVLSLSAVLLITGRFVSAQEIEIGKASDPLNVKSGTVASNVFFNDTSLSGLSVQDAVDLVEESFSSLNETDFTIVSPTDDSLTYSAACQELGISWDLTDAESTLLSCELTGNLVERYKKAKDLQASPVILDTNLTIDTDLASSFFSDLGSSWKTSPQNAMVSARTGSLVVTPAKTGVSYDFTDAVRQLQEDVLSFDIITDGSYTITPEVTTTEPDISTEQAEGFTVIGAYTTYYDEPDTEILYNRENNLVVSCAGIDGSVFAPGETISALAMYGDVSLAGGYKEAGTYSNGEHVDQVGGGICQTTTTLYNAGLYAELEILYRRNHSMYVSYVTPSRDAMVYAAGNSDFKMANNTSDYIILEAWVDKSNNSININIIGHEDHAADHSVEYESEVLEVSSPTINRVVDSTMPVGIDCDRGKKYRTTETCYPGVKSRLWKITTDGDTVTRTLQNSGDTYKASVCTIYTAADTTCTIDTVYSEQKGQVICTYKLTFLNGANLNSNVAAWSKSEQDTFNSEMSRLMRQSGYTWPNSTKETTTSATTTTTTTTEEETTTTTTAEAATTTAKETTATTTAEAATTTAQETTTTAAQ